MLYDKFNRMKAKHNLFVIESSL
ncbi:protein of unknown function [Candidatus Methylocalor cossyra]|uniref:Uncharacterized protein n=1 Tax=Candidatus Methylocalor cossyra TaxID=3108543 RepID=A0ABP1C9E9_9GAMM